MEEAKDQWCTLRNEQTYPLLWGSHHHTIIQSFSAVSYFTTFAWGWFPKESDLKCYCLLLGKPSAIWKGVRQAMFHMKQFYFFTLQPLELKTKSPRYFYNTSNSFWIFIRVHCWEGQLKMTTGLLPIALCARVEGYGKFILSHATDDWLPKCSSSNNLRDRGYGWSTNRTPTPGQEKVRCISALLSKIVPDHFFCCAGSYYITVSHTIIIIVDRQCRQDCYNTVMQEGHMYRAFCKLNE